MKQFIVMILAAVLHYLPSQASTAIYDSTYTFIGSGSWSSPSNWVPNGELPGIPPNPLPGSSEIIINGTGSAVLDINQTFSPGNSVLRIYNSKTLVISSSVALESHCMIVVNGGILVNDGTVILYNQMGNFSGGIINNNNLIVINNGGRIWTENGELNNAGTINLNENASLRNDPYSTLSNSGTIDNNTGSLFENNGIMHNVSGGFLNNNTGAIFSNFVILNNNAGGDLTNAGTLTNGGTITNNGNFENDNVLTNNAEIINNNYFKNNSLDSLINNGTFNNGSTLDNDGILMSNYAISNTGVFNNLGGSNLILNSNPSIFPGGTFNWNVGSTVTIGPNGTMTLTAPFELQPSRIFVIATGGSFIVL